MATERLKIKYRTQK